METKEIKINLPIDITTLGKIGNVTAIIETVGNYDCVVSVNGILYRVNKNDISEASEDEKYKIQKFLDDNNLVIDCKKKEIRKKRWRAEKQETFYYINSINKIGLDNE